MVPFVITKSATPEIQELVNSLIRVFNSIDTNPLLNNPRIAKTNVFTSGVDLVINHKLNRIPIGYIPINLNAAAIIFTSSTLNNMTKTQVILQANANVTADILFF